MSKIESDGYYETYWPRTPRQTGIQPLAKRLSTLEGKTVVQLWDFLFRGDEVFEILEEALKERYPSVRFVSWREFGNTHGRDEGKVLEDLPRHLKAFGADAVISGMGC